MQLENKFESWTKVWGQLNKTGLRFICLKLQETNTKGCDTQRQILLANIREKCSLVF
jgi:hypothetical protein